MSILKGKKLQRLMSIPKGIVLTSNFLKNQGFNPQLLAKYKKGNWLSSIGDGAYLRHGDKVDWKGALSAMQEQLKLPVHCGARTALALQGYSHYVESATRDVFLFGSPSQRLPQWFEKYDWGVRVIYKMTNLFPENLAESFVEFPVGGLMLRIQLLSPRKIESATEVPMKDFGIRISSPERALMEMLYLVPAKQGFDEAERIMESMMTLRPALVQKLLENCNSIKVKRLFLYMAEKANLSWVEKLTLAEVTLGKGDRTIIKGGHLDPKYHITVPLNKAD
jgi:Transcriptional regulator, AbiEi antitoxin, Type IV TA system/Transcriptional regulator, AbiEi antitoxin N-terminal domain